MGTARYFVGGFSDRADFLERVKRAYITALGVEPPSAATIKISPAIGIVTDGHYSSWSIEMRDFYKLMEDGIGRSRIYILFERYSNGHGQTAHVYFDVRNMNPDLIKSVMEGFRALRLQERTDLTDLFV